jgi:nucleoside recognition membrane protein YjiH
MVVYGFFSLFSIVMTVTILFMLIFLKNQKLVKFLGLSTVLVTAVQFVLLNMTDIPNFGKSIVILITLILYFCIVGAQLHSIFKRDGII